MNGAVSKSCLHEWLRSIVFALKVMDLGIFNFLNILENCYDIFEILGSIQRMVCEKLICLCDFSHIFPITKIMALGKVKVLIFLTGFLFLIFDISRELPSQI